MIGIGPFAVFALGLRHGADPDHLAAIDNLTRNAVARRPILSRFVGSLFALGHSVMVLAIAAIVGILGARFAAHGAIVEAIGTWISIVVLIIIAVANLRQLSQGDGSGRLVGVKTQFLPRSLRETGNPLLAIPVGFLFGFGFETSSQVAAYTVAFGSGGVAGALLIGAMFCLGMIASDTLDSVLVHRLVSDRSAAMPRTVRVWIWSVTVMALVVAAYELAQVLGWRSPVPDIAVSGSLVAALLVIFAYVFFSTKRERCSIAVPLGGPIARGEELP